MNLCHGKCTCPVRFLFAFLSGLKTCPLCFFMLCFVYDNKWIRLPKKSFPGLVSNISSLLVSPEDHPDRRLATSRPLLSPSLDHHLRAERDWKGKGLLESLPWLLHNSYFIRHTRGPWGLCKLVEKLQNKCFSASFHRKSVRKRKIGWVCLVQLWKISYAINSKGREKTKTNN